MNEPTAVITPFYTAIAASIFIVLSFRASWLRRRFGIPIGSGGNKQLARAVAVHAHFAEYTPITLLLIFFLELRGQSSSWIHGLCLALIAGRLLHAYGVSQIDENYRFRELGMILTLGSLISVTGRLLASYAS